MCINFSRFSQDSFVQTTYSVSISVSLGCLCVLYTERYQLFSASGMLCYNVRRYNTVSGCAHTSYKAVYGEQKHMQQIEVSSTVIETKPSVLEAPSQGVAISFVVP